MPSSRPHPPKIKILNVPSDIGSTIKGKSLAPAAIQAANLSGKLSEVGYDVQEIDVLSEGPAVWSFDARVSGNGVRNEEGNAEVCRRVKESVREALAGEGDEETPFVLVVGGECCIVPAILSAFWQGFKGKKIGLLYFDGDCDLTIPGEPGATQNLASMTFTHLTMRDGALESMRPFTRPDGQGVCDAENTVLFGLNASLQGNSRSQMAYLFDEGYRVFTSTAVAADPIASARKALAWLEERVDVFLLHLDVDAIDPTFFPLANVGNRTGVGFEEAMGAVKVFLGSAKCGALCVAEVNPGHDDDRGRMVGMLVGEVVSGLKGRKEVMGGGRS